MKDTLTCLFTAFMVGVVFGAGVALGIPLMSFCLNLAGLSV